MTEKHAADVLADECDRSAEGWLSEVETRRQAAAMLRTIPAMEVELMEQARIVGMGAEREARLMARVAELERERDALRADLETEVRLNNEGQAREDALRAEVEALRADAERYLWLVESESLVWPSVDLANACHRAERDGNSSAIDAAIDAARKS